MSVYSNINTKHVELSTIKYFKYIFCDSWAFTCKDTEKEKLIGVFYRDVSTTNITTNLNISTKEHNCHILLSSYSRMAIDNIINSPIIASDTAQTDWEGWRGCTQHPSLRKHNKIIIKHITTVHPTTKHASGTHTHNTTNEHTANHT
jgi:hypothetical protein